MSQKRTMQNRLPRTTWVFPLLTAALVLCLMAAGTRRIPAELLKQHLRDAYGISEAQLEKLSLEMPGGWPVNWSSLAPHSKHEHPLPPKFSVVNTGTGMIFAHIGDGAVPGTDRFLQTTFVLVNDSNQDATGTIELYDNDGAPLAATIDGVTGSTFPFTLKKGETKQFVTSGNGGIKSGWAHIHSDQPIVGSCSFGIRNPVGDVFTDVGVAESTRGTEFTLFADSIGAANTGLAAVNPSEADSITLQFELLRADGSSVSIVQRILAPRAHIALFLNELFPNVANINEFEGSIRITSTKEFSGITLRALGDQLTSLPMVPPPPAGSTRTRLAFPHTADGLLGQLKIATTVILFNNTSERATGKVEFFDGEGKPMTVTIGSTTGTSFNFSLNPRAVTRMTTAASGTVNVGWARVSMDKPINGAAIFHIFDSGGRILTEVGVDSSVLRKTFNIIADTLGAFNTGLAVANPSEKNANTTVGVSLYDKNGVFQASTSFPLNALFKKALFLTELFPNFKGIQEFQGRAKISSSEFLAAVALRQVNEKITSTPSFLPQHGFAPVSTLTFLQNLAGTAPALEWLLHQNNSDFSLEKVKICAPELGLRTDTVEVGSQIMQGYFAGGTNSRLFGFFVSNKSSLEFDFLIPQSSNGTAVQGNGKITGNSSGGLELELTLADRKAGTYVGSDSDFHFFLNPDIIVAPSSPRSVTLTTEFLSVSTKTTQENRVTRRTTQAVSFLAADSSKANLTKITPLFPAPGGILTIEGTNFGSSPKVSFSTSPTAAVEVTPITKTATSLEALVPDSFAGGDIRINNGGGPGNSYRAKSLFAPTLTFQTATRTGGAETSFNLVIKQPVEQFALDRFTLSWFQADRTLSGLSTGAVVGSGKYQQSSTTEFDIKVESSASEKAVLQVVQKGSTGVIAQIIVEKIAGEIGGLRFSYVPTNPASKPVLLDLPLELQLNFTALPVKLPSTGRPSVIAATLVSGPTDPLRSVSAIRVSQDFSFTTQ